MKAVCLAGLSCRATAALGFVTIGAGIQQDSYYMMRNYKVGLSKLDVCFNSTPVDEGRKGRSFLAMQPKARTVVGRAGFRPQLTTTLP